MKCVALKIANQKMDNLETFMLLHTNFKELEKNEMEECEKLALDYKIFFENELAMWKEKRPKKKYFTRWTNVSGHQICVFIAKEDFSLNN